MKDRHQSAYITSWPGEKRRRARGVKRRTRLQGKKQRFFFMPFALPKSLNSTSDRRARWGIPPVISRKSCSTAALGLAACWRWSPGEESKLKRLRCDSIAVASEQSFALEKPTVAAVCFCSALPHICARGENITKPYQCIVMDLVQMLFPSVALSKLKP